MLNSKGQKSPFYKKVVSFFFVLLITFFLIEGLLAVCSHYSLIEIKKPPYTLEISRQEFAQDIHPVIGTWHYPLVSVRHKQGCLDVSYQSNSFGSRDRERNLTSIKSRAVVLGDSFMEGLGLPSHQRLSEVMESLTGNEHLNFGVTGTGPLHYLLVYQEIAKKFEHDTVLVGILPQNDFLDLDPEYGKRVYANRYKPYLIGEYPNYQIKYFREKLKLEEQRNLIVTNFFKIKIFFRGYSYTYNALRFAWNHYKLKKHIPEKGMYSGYYYFTQEQWQRLVYVLKEFKKLTVGKRLVVFTIPTVKDFIRNPSGSDTPAEREMIKLSKELNFEYIDLFKEMAKKVSDPKEYYLSCDGHWNDKGNQTAANIIYNKLYNQFGIVSQN